MSATRNVKPSRIKTQRAVWTWTVAMLSLVAVASACAPAPTGPTIPPSGPRIISRVAAVGLNPVDVAVVGPSLWVVCDQLVNPVWTVDRATLAAQASVDLSEVKSVVFDGTDVWIGGNDITRIDPVTGQIKATLNDSATDITFDGRYIWFVNQHADRLGRIDPSTNTVTASKIIADAGLNNVAIGDGSVWLSDYLGNDLLRYDPETLALQAIIPVGNSPRGVLFAAGSVWTSNYGPDTVSRVDPAANEVVATIPIGFSPAGPMAFDGANVWVANTRGIDKIDPSTNTSNVRVSGFSGALQGMDYDGSYLWVTSWQGGLYKVDLDG